MNYSLQIKESAFKELLRIDKPQRLRIIEAIEAQPDNPLVGKSLKGDLSGLRRIRVGEFLVVYELIHPRGLYTPGVGPR